MSAVHPRIDFAIGPSIIPSSGLKECAAPPKCCVPIGRERYEQDKRWGAFGPRAPTTTALGGSPFLSGSSFPRGEYTQVHRGSKCGNAMHALTARQRRTAVRRGLARSGCSRAHRPSYGSHCRIRIVCGVFPTATGSPRQGSKGRGSLGRHKLHYCWDGMMLEWPVQGFVSGTSLSLSRTRALTFASAHLNLPCRARESVCAHTLFVCQDLLQPVCPWVGRTGVPASWEATTRPFTVLPGSCAVLYSTSPVLSFA